MRYRTVEQLAAACDVSVDRVRYYQSRGLLPQPEREGRVAWYDDGHVEPLAAPGFVGLGMAHLASSLFDSRSGL